MVCFDTGVRPGPVSFALYYSDAGSGFSYGSTLGVTIASMFPGRIDRMVLDGIVNVHEYFNDWLVVSHPYAILELMFKSTTGIVRDMPTPTRLSPPSSLLVRQAVPDVPWRETELPQPNSKKSSIPFSKTTSSTILSRAERNLSNTAQPKP